MLIPKSDIVTKQRIDTAIEATIESGLAKWNGIKPAKLTMPLADGDGLRSNGEPFGSEAAGCYVLTASSTEQVEVVDIALQPIINAKEIYRGAIIYASITFFSYSKGRKGIGCGLNAVLKYKDGESLGGGRITAAKAFAPLIRQLAAHDIDAPPFNTGYDTAATA